MATLYSGEAAVRIGAPSHHFDGIFFQGQTSVEFRLMRDRFRQLPQQPLPADMRVWWDVTKEYRSEWEHEHENGAPSKIPFRRHFLLSNRHSAELEDGADIVAPVFWILASWDPNGRLRFSEEVLSGVICYGELKNAARHSFSDLNSPEGHDRKQAA